jgi:hypothetical protein
MTEFDPPTLNTCARYLSAEHIHYVQNGVPIASSESLHKEPNYSGVERV